jgi:hypothetical protein
VAALSEIYENYFKALGIAAGFQTILEEFPLLKDDGISIRISLAYDRHQEGPRLEREGSHKRVMLRIQTCRLFNHGFFQTYLRHCLLKASDMVDPEFAYSSPIEFGGKTPAENEMLNKCFNELWDQSIAARLGYKACRITPEERASFIFFSSGESDPTRLRSVVTQKTLISMAREAIFNLIRS